MTTWGPSKRRTKRSSSPARRPRAGAADDASRSTGGSSRSGDGRSKRERAGEELRAGIDERQHELLGVGLIVGGVVLALATFFDLAGPLGSGLRTLLGWLFGFALFAVPAVLVGVGIALIRRGRSASPWRLAIGWTVIGLATLGLLHVTWGPDGVSDLDQLEDAGGVIGGFVGEPLQALIAPAGGIVVLLGLV